MDFEQIKNLRLQNGERYIFIENGKPVLVLLSFEDYQRIFSKQQKEIKFKGKVSNPPSEKTSEKNEGELTLEDLPF